MKASWLSHHGQVGALERAALLRCLRRGHLSGHGPESARVEALLRRKLGVSHAFLTPSGTAALELALMALGIGQGHEVILPSFSFSTDATSILRQGARPVFAEVQPGTLNLDPQDAARRVTRRTRAILLVHYAGLPCDMDAFLSLRRGKRLALVEDAALAFGSSWRGRALGSLGDIGCFSFHATKQLSCGEGGALICSRKDLAARVEVMREKGTDRSAFLRGERDRYTWRGPGSSYLLADPLAALLGPQLFGEGRLRRRLRAAWQAYQRSLAPLERAGLLRLARPLPQGSANGHLFWFLLEGRWKGRRDEALKRLQKRGVPATFHYVPLHGSPYGRQLSKGLRLRLPVTEHAGRDLVRLPMHPGLRPSDCQAIARSVGSALREG